jgi:hypothetical protein
MQSVKLLRSVRLPVLASAILFLTGPVSAANLTFVPTSSELACNEARPVDVWIDGATTDLRGFSLVIEFDPNIVDPIAVEAGAALTSGDCPSYESWNNAAAVGDSVYFDAAGLGCSVDGPGPIARIWFSGVADGMTELSVRSAILRDSENRSITVDSEPGGIVVSCPVSARARSWTTLKRVWH